MAHYAKLDSNNIVSNVFVGMDESNTEDLPEEFTSWEEYYTDYLGVTVKRTSYNTLENAHRDGGTAFRGNFAGIGMKYDSSLDAFIYPKPYPSWTLDENYTWQPPVPYPTDGGVYTWADGSGTWIEIDYPASE
jgi:hypothetical protein